MSRSALVKYREPASHRMGNKDDSVAEKIANILIQEKLENGVHAVTPRWGRIGGIAGASALGAGVAGHIANEYQEDSNGNFLVNPTTGSIVSTAAGFGAGGLLGLNLPQHPSPIEPSVVTPNGVVVPPNPINAEMNNRHRGVRRGVAGAMIGSTGAALMNLAGSLSDRPDDVFEEDQQRARTGAWLAGLAAAGGAML